MSTQQIIGIIPARYQSVRLPGKPLMLIEDKPMIYHVYHRAIQSSVMDKVCVATDDERIIRACQDFDIPVIMTSRNCRTGSDRVNEAARQLEGNIIVNIQGDEPLIDPKSIDKAVEPFLSGNDVLVSTLCYPICDFPAFMNPNVVKVVFTPAGKALYFSRSPIPGYRTNFPNSHEEILYGYKHLGLYVYEKSILNQFCQWESGQLELRENLEQLRFLEHHVDIQIQESPSDSVGVDTQEDLEKVRKAIMGFPGQISS